MIELYPELKDPKWQIFARRAIQGFSGVGYPEEVLEFMKENKIPEKYLEQTGLGLSVAKWGIVSFDEDQIYDPCGQCAISKNCISCFLHYMHNSICNKVEENKSFKRKMFLILYGRYKEQHKEEFGL